MYIYIYKRPETQADLDLCQCNLDPHPDRQSLTIIAYPQSIVGEDEDLQFLQGLDVVRDLGELVGAQGELHHVHPQAHVQRQGRQLVVLHVQLGQRRRPREDAQRDVVDLVVLHVDGLREWQGKHSE